MVWFSLFLPLLIFITLGFIGRWCGRNGAALIGGSLLFMGLFGVLLSGISPFTVFVMYGSSWIGQGVVWGLCFDPVGSEMVGLILTITLCVFIYSTEYMGHDPYLIRFLAYLSLFGFFMIVLVTAPTVIQLFIGWEGVGMVSFLLINFWWMRLEANRSAFKAMIFNRVGDSFYLVALVGIIVLYGTGEIASLLFLDLTVRDVVSSEVVCVRELIGVGVFLAAVGKSAQVGLHAWLPDAMEGPTPVSSLLHSATMVTAGVFLLVRFADLVSHTSVFKVILLSGGVTALLNAVWGFFQWDLKKIIAFSTCSQLGLMVVAVAVDAHLGFYHLMNHGFFKALLFLSAGSVIHGVANEQDVRKMGGLFNYLPVTAGCMLIGSVALAGFPFLAGFYSKERILFSLAAVDWWVGVVLYIMLLLASVFTVLYSIKILMGVFWSPTLRVFSFRVVWGGVNESSFFMLGPMLVLAFLTLVFGFVVEGYFVGPGCLGFDFIPLEVVYPSYKWFLVGLFLCLVYDWRFMVRVRRIIGRINRSQFVTLVGWGLANRLGFISIYRIMASWVLRQGYVVSFLLLDRGVLERVGPTGIVRIGLSGLEYLARGQWVSLSYYLLEFGFGLATFVLSLVWGFGIILVFVLGRLLLSLRNEGVVIR